MRKLQLKLDELQVRSFSTAAPLRSAGTVLGNLDFELEEDPASVAPAPTGSTCMVSQGCPANTFSCYCYTGTLPQM